MNSGLLIFMGFALYCLASAFVYAYYYNSPRISVDRHVITFGKEKFYLKDIKEIIFTGKMPFEFYMMTKQKEGTALVFNDGTRKYFFDDLLSNSWEIKSFLEQTVINNSEYAPVSIEKPDTHGINLEHSETYKGNQFLNLGVIFGWGALIYFTIQIDTFSLALLPFGFVFPAVFIFFLSWQAHYFCLTDDYLIVRNQNLFWLIKAYRIKDIKEIVFESGIREPNYLRIITNDFRSIRYAANFLRNKTWIEMKSSLELKGIPVRNECVPEKSYI